MCLSEAREHRAGEKRGTEQTNTRVHGWHGACPFSLRRDAQPSFYAADYSDRHRTRMRLSSQLLLMHPSSQRAAVLALPTTHSRHRARALANFLRRCNPPMRRSAHNLPIVCTYLRLHAKRPPCDVFAAPLERRKFTRATRLVANTPAEGCGTHGQPAHPALAENSRRTSRAIFGATTPRQPSQLGRSCSTSTRASSPTGDGPADSNAGRSKRPGHPHPATLGS